MQIPASWASEMSYLGKLLQAGVSANEATQAEWARAAREAWLPGLIGMAVGVSAARLARKKVSGRDAIVFGLIGGVCGFGGAVAWSSRQATTTMVHDAAKNIDAVRNDHWLKKHPICYG
jgi:hypothetical protein